MRTMRSHTGAASAGPWVLTVAPASLVRRWNAIALLGETTIVAWRDDWLLMTICAPGVGGFGLFQVHERAPAGTLLHSAIGEKPVPSVVNARLQCVTLLRSPDAAQRIVYGVPP